MGSFFAIFSKSQNRRVLTQPHGELEFGELATHRLLLGRPNFGPIFLFWRFTTRWRRRIVVSLSILRFRLHADVAVVGGTRDSQRFANVGDRDRRIPKHFLGEQHPRMLAFNARATAHASTRSCCRQSSSCSFLNQTTLELSERGKDIENQLARSGGRINGTLIQGTKTDTTNPKIFNERDQTSHGASKSIQPPDDENVTFVERGQAFR